VDVGCAEAELPGARLEVDVWGVGLRELAGDDLRPVWGAVVDDYELPVEVSRSRGLAGCAWWEERGGGGGDDVQFGEGAV
jgi:hypothetical protein